DHGEVRRGLGTRRAVHARRRLRKDVTRSRRRLDHRRWLRRERARRRRRGSGLLARRSRRYDVLGRFLPARDVLDGLLVRLFLLRFALGRGRLALRLPLRSLGGAEELRERTLTHRRALSRHCSTPPSPDRGTTRLLHLLDRISAPIRL